MSQLASAAFASTNPYHAHSVLNPKQQAYVDALYMAYNAPEQYQVQYNLSLLQQNKDDLVRCPVDPEVKSNFNYLGRMGVDTETREALFRQTCIEALLHPHQPVHLPAFSANATALEKTVQSAKRLMVRSLHEQVKSGGPL